MKELASLMLTTPFLNGCDRPAPDAIGVPTSPLKLRRIATLGLGFADSSINTAVYRHRALLRLPADYLIASFYDEQGFVRLSVLRPSLVLAHSVRIVPRLEDRLLGDGHCVISLGVSPDGRVQVLYGAHGTLPFYGSFRVDDLLTASELIADAWPFPLTYPQFYDFAEDCVVLFRRDPEYGIGLCRYDAVQQRLSEEFELLLLLEGYESVYVDQVAVEGNDIFISWMYREPNAADGRVRNVGCHMAMSRDAGRTWASVAGKPLEFPLRQADDSLALDIPSDRGLLNQSCVAWGPDGRAYQTLQMKDGAGVPQIFLATIQPGPGTVDIDAVSENMRAFELDGRGTLVLPLSRAEVAVSDENVHVCYRQDDQVVFASRALGARAGTPWRRWEERIDQLGSWEPNLDASRLRSNSQLLLLVQAVRQGPADTGIAGPPTPVFVYELEEA